jgi:hypothetical protein
MKVSITKAIRMVTTVARGHPLITGEQELLPNAIKALEFFSRNLTGEEVRRIDMSIWLGGVEE